MLQYIIPEYIDLYGDCCIVCDSDSETIHYKRMYPVIKELFRQKYIDLVAVKHTSNLMLDQKNLIPLIYSNNEIMIPIKVRKAIIHNDPNYGYVNYFSIKEILDNHTIILNNNKELYFMDNIRTIKKRIKMAKQVIELNNITFPFIQDKLLIIPLSPHYQQPSTTLPNILFPTMSSFSFLYKNPPKS